MAGTNTCFSLVRGRAMRVTRLDGCGAVDLGPDSSIVSDGFITVQLSAQTDEGETISVTNAAGKVCILDEPCPVFTGYDVQVEFCGVNPLLLELMTGQVSVLDSAGNRVGFRMNTAIDACGSGFALEVWSSVPSAVCDPNAGVSYGYFLVPFIKGGVIGDFTIGNDAVNFTLSGAKSKDGNNWDVGPFDVIKDDTGAPAAAAGPARSRRPPAHAAHHRRAARSLVRPDHGRQGRHGSHRWHPGHLDPGSGLWTGRSGRPDEWFGHREPEHRLDQRAVRHLGGWLVRSLDWHRLGGRKGPVRPEASSHGSFRRSGPVAAFW
jgi:hypothetical protein